MPLTGVQALESLLSQCNFYGEIATVLSRLYMGRTVNPNGFNRADDWSTRCLSDQHVPSEARLQLGQYAVVCNGNSGSSSSNEHRGL